MTELQLSGGDFFAYEETGGSNLDLPDIVMSPDGSALSLNKDVYPNYNIILCISTYSATAPLTAFAKQFGFRGATLHGVNDIILNSGLAVDYNEVSKDAAYLHYTSNNTLFGTQFHDLPDSHGKPRVVDASSDICGVPIEVSEHDVIYAGAQKNLGPSGVTVVILSPWAAGRPGDGLPTMLDYRTHISKGSMFNTPNTSGVYVLDRVLAWMERNGGLEGAIQRNRKKAETLYGLLDSSDFWRPHASKDSRSVMNVTWRLADESLEGGFLAEAEENGMGGLRGHRSVGGIRASIYNACPL